MPDRFTRLQLATRIHFDLLREHGLRIDVGRMLRQRGYARQVLRRCGGAASVSLHDLVERFDALSAADDARAHLECAALHTRAALARLTQARGAA
jgi:hypothetical protein